MQVTSVFKGWEEQELAQALDAAQKSDTTQINALVLQAITSRGVLCRDLNELSDHLQGAGLIDAALKVMGRSLVLDERQAPVWANKAICHHLLGQGNQALSHYHTALNLDPQSVLLRTNLAGLMLSMAREEEAIYHVTISLILDPAHANAWYNLALVLETSGQVERGVSAYHRAISLLPSHAQAMTNLGKLFQEQGAFGEAQRHHRRALIFLPALKEAVLHDAAILSELREYDRAILVYERAIALDPLFVKAHLGLSMTLLLKGDFIAGWRENEWRIEDYGRVSPEKKWRRLIPEDMGDIKGKRVLLHWEQGFGDTIQFCRYGTVLADLGAEVTLIVQPELLTLIQGFDPRVTVLNAFKGDFDAYAFLMSLPHLTAFDPERVPAKAAYLYASPNLPAAWSDRLGAKKTLRVGLVWSGSDKNQNDHNRSIPLESIKELLRMPFEFHCLQKEIRERDRPWLSEFDHLHVHDAELSDFEDTAGLVSCMDLVISVDTSIAHLSGALGRPLWLLIPYTPDNRWFLDRQDSPWYPSAKLYRQGIERDWAPVLSRLIHDLSAFLSL